jgi:hypothetical protein
MDTVEKANRIASVRGPVNSEEEVRRRFPEVDAIYHDELREKTIEYFMRATPAYFWEKPSSSSGKYHPPDERGKHGLWIHSKRVFATYAHISESLTEMQLIDEYERNCGKVAALIHDTYQGGWPSQNDTFASDHDVIAAAVANYMIGMPDEVVHIIHSHMGPWSAGKEPETKNELLFHMSDMSSAASNHTPGVYFPAEELTSEWPDLQTIEVEEDEYI